MDTVETFIPQQKSKRTPLTHMKQISKVVIIVSITATILLEVSVLVNLSSSAVDDYVMNYTSQDTNHTLCSYLKQFKLSEDKKISVCSIYDAVRVDIRIFYNDQASIRGIWLDVTEWKTLLKLWGNIQTAIAVAEKEQYNRNILHNMI